LFSAFLQAFRFAANITLFFTVIFSLPLQFSDAMEKEAVVKQKYTLLYSLLLLSSSAISLL